MKKENKTLIISIIISLILIFLIFYYAYAKNSVKINIAGYAIKENEDVSENSDPLQFYPRMRFENRIIYYRIDVNCSSLHKDRMRKAFEILSNKTEIVKFYEVRSNANILISCSNLGNTSEKYIKVGEGGAYSISNSGYFYVINNGKIELSNDAPLCTEPNTELHELLHVLGFKHSLNNQSIIYNISDCNQVLAPEIISRIKNLYSIETLPDLYFENLGHSRDSDYLNFNATILNKGLMIADKVSLNIYSGNKKINSFDIGNINYGEGKIINVEDLYAGSDRKFNFTISSSQDLNQSDNSMIVNL